MAHLIAIFFFSGLLVGLALVLQYTIRGAWDDMVAALQGRPMARHRIKATAPAAVTVTVPRSRQRVAAA